MNVQIIRATGNPDDLACRAARGDYSTETSDSDFEELMESVEGETLGEKRINLLRHCIKRGHWGVFEHSSVTFSVEGMSRVCMAQLTRHRHASFDVQSLRYMNLMDKVGRELEETFYYPPSLSEDYVSRQGENLDEAEREYLTKQFTQHFGESVNRYNTAVRKGMPKEDARMFLPLATKVNMTFTVSLRSLMHIRTLRGEADAQKEIRELTEQCMALAREWSPLGMNIFEAELPMKVSP